MTTSAANPATAVPIVDYLELTDGPHLVANVCASCGAAYFDRRNACASCGQTRFEERPVDTEGTVVSFTIVHFAAPGVPVPFVALVADCGGIKVRANLINTVADPAHVTLGMPVRLATYAMGADSSGVEAIGFGFEPIS